MASTGLTFPGTGADNTAVGSVSWGNQDDTELITYHKLDDGNDVTTDANVGPGATTYYLFASNFGFAVPAGATIDGIEVKVETKMNAAGQAAGMDCSAAGAKIFIAGAAAGTANTTDIWLSDDPTYTATTLGSSTDKWGLTPSVAQVNASDFGVGITATRESVNGKCRVDYIQMNIYYTEAASGPANLKTTNTITKANTKTANTIAIASVKTWNTIV